MNDQAIAAKRISTVESGAVEDVEMKRTETIEEGQAEEGEDMSTNISDMHVITREFKRNEKPSNFIQILYHMEVFLNRFQESPIETNKNAKIQVNYPKYLAKFSLLNLQFNDIMFRKTFMYQIMVFVDWIRNPIKDTTMVPKIDETEMKFADYIFARAQNLLNSSESSQKDIESST